MCARVSKIDVVFIHRPALYRRGRAFMSGAMIDRCNANSAHHRAFITSPPPPPPSSFMKSLHPTYAESRYAAMLTSRLTISVIYHPWKSGVRSADWFLHKGREVSLAFILIWWKFFFSSFIKIIPIISPKLNNLLDRFKSTLRKSSIYLLSWLEKERKEERRGKKGGKGNSWKRWTRPTSRYSSFRFKEFPR